MTYDQDLAAPASSIATRRPRQHAVVFSGNGYNAAYEVGVLKAILHGISPSTHGEKVKPQIYAGTSVGSYNAAFMVSRSELDDIAVAGASPESRSISAALSGLPTLRYRSSASSGRLWDRGFSGERNHLL